MSAIRGIFIDFFIFPTASAASILGTATRTISHPAFSKAFIWLTVDFTSTVSVLVMDWTEIGELLPIFMLPTEICLVFLRVILLANAIFGQILCQSCLSKYSHT